MSNFITNADGPDTINGTSDTDFVWIDSSGGSYYERGVRDTDLIQGLKRFETRKIGNQLHVRRVD